MKFLYPVDPDSRVTQTFQQHVDRARAHGWQFYYGGIDWAIITGTPIKAAHSGSVKVTRKDATGYGTHVRLEQDDYLTIYGHLQSFSVKEGDHVEAGQVIGLSDNTGNSSGPHLHFELRYRGTPIDPMPLLVTKLDGEDEEEQPTEEEVEVEIVDKKFPKLPKARITAVALNLREEASVQAPIVGLLPRGTIVEVLRTVKDGNNIWIQVGYKQFAAMVFDNTAYAVWKG